MTSGSHAGTATSAPGAKPALAVRVSCDEDDVIVTLADGRTIRTPLTERLRAATVTQRDSGRVLGVSEDELEELAGFEPAPREG